MTATMKGLLTAAAVALATATSSALAADTYDFDTAHTDVVFNISHFGYSDTWGRFNEVDGTVTLDKDDLAGSSVEVTIQAASIDTNHKKRDEHLRSADFLNVKEFPTITFKSTKVDPTGEMTAKVTGDLTIHGTTKPVILDVTVNKIAPHPLPDYNNVETAGLSARTTIKRSEFGVDAFVPAVGDEMEIIIEVEAFKQ